MIPRRRRNPRGRLYYRIASTNASAFLGGSLDDCLPEEMRKAKLGEDAPDPVDHIDDVLDEMRSRAARHPRPSVKDILKPY